MTAAAKQMDFWVGWDMTGKWIHVGQTPNRGKTPMGILLTPDQARQLIPQLASLLAAGPPNEDDN